MSLDPDKFRLQQRIENPNTWRTCPLQVPPELALGHLEKLDEQQLEDLRADVGAEITRRNGERAKNV